MLFYTNVVEVGLIIGLCIRFWEQPTTVTIILSCLLGLAIGRTIDTYSMLTGNNISYPIRIAKEKLLNLIGKN